MMHVFAVLSTDSEISLRAASDSARLVWVFYGALLLAGIVSLVSIGKRLIASNAAILVPADGHEEECVDSRSRVKTTAWRRHKEWLCSRLVTWRMAGRICLILVGLQFAFLAFGRAAIASGLFSLNQLEPYWVVVQGLIFHLAGILIVMLVIRRAGLSLRDIFGIRARNPIGQARRGAFFYLAALPVFVGATVAYHLLLLFLGYQISMQEVVFVFLSQQPAYALLFNLVLAIVIAPIAEEILFRGIALPLLAKSISTVPAILISSLFFALVHFHVPSFAPLFVLALAFSIAYIHTGNILVPIIMHSLFNGVNLAILLTLSSGNAIVPPT